MGTHHGRISSSSSSIVTACVGVGWGACRPVGQRIILINTLAKTSMPAGRPATWRHWERWKGRERIEDVAEQRANSVDHAFHQTAAAICMTGSKRRFSWRRRRQKLRSCGQLACACTVKNIRIYADILWRVYHILTQPVPYYTFASVNRRNNEARGVHIYGKLATKCPIWMSFFAWCAPSKADGSQISLPHGTRKYLWKIVNKKETKSQKLDMLRRNGKQPGVCEVLRKES